MTPLLYAGLERAHGILAVLGLAVLLHPVMTLRRAEIRSRWTQWSADLGAGLLLAPFVIGWQIYPSYRQHIKPRLWLEHHETALRFESKEHLALLATSLAVSGALTLRASQGHRALIQLAHALLVTAWGCGAVTAMLGIHVASMAM
jgi:hypothetical protein